MSKYDKTLFQELGIPTIKAKTPWGTIDAGVVLERPLCGHLQGLWLYAMTNDDHAEALSLAVQPTEWFLDDDEVANLDPSRTLYCPGNRADTLEIIEALEAAGLTRRIAEVSYGRPAKPGWLIDVNVDCLPCISVVGCGDGEMPVLKRGCTRISH